MENKTTIRLEGLIAAEQDKMKRCTHLFDDPIVVMHKTQVGRGERRVELGVDSYMGPAYYEEVLVPGWTRECHLCGLLQHTRETTPTSVGPDFSKV